MHHSTMSAEERREHWAQTLAADGGQIWDWRPELARLVDYTRVYLDVLVGPAFRIRFPSPDSTPWPPRPPALASAAAAKPGTKPPRLPKTWVMGDTLWRLGLYGRYGVMGEDIVPKKRLKHVEVLVADAEVLLRYSPFAQAADFLEKPKGTAVIQRIAKLAVSRRTLENGQGYVHPTSLAILGGVSEGRIRNLMSEGRTFQSTRGAIEAKSALQWLEGRPAYWSSIWQHEGIGLVTA